MGREHLEESRYVKVCKTQLKMLDFFFFIPLVILGVHDSLTLVNKWNRVPREKAGLASLALSEYSVPLRQADSSYLSHETSIHHQNTKGQTGEH